MRRAVLADTGPLYAAVDPADQYHTQAQQELKRLEQEGLEVFVAYANLLECYTLILHRLGISTAFRWLNEIQEGASLINPTLDDYHAAMSRIQRYRDQAFTLFDVVLAILSERLALPVWTYDHHFDVMRVPVWR
jgi:predicted nucleic acid-binding protein